MASITNIFGGTVGEDYDGRYLGRFALVADLPDASGLQDGATALVNGDTTANNSWYKVSSGAWAKDATIGGSGSSTVGTLTAQGSLTGGGDLSTDQNISLVNDESSPGNSKVYGTDGAGAKGWQDLPSGDWDTLTNKPSTFAPEAHQSSHHYTTGSDPIRAFDVRAVPWASGLRPPTDTDDSGDDLTAGAIWGDFTSYPVELWVLVDERPLQAVWRRLMTEATVFDGTNNGVVEAPASSTGLFLKDDATWDTLSIDAFAGAGGTGAVPDPGVEASKFLRDDGAWATPANSATPQSTALDPGAPTWNPTLANDTVYKITVNEDTTVTLDSAATSDDVMMSALWFKRQGYTITIDNGTPDPDTTIVLSGASTGYDKIAVEHWLEDGSAVFHYWQYGTYLLSSSTLPTSGLVSVHELTSDGNDTVGSNNLVAQGAAAIIGTGDHGLKLASATSDAVLITSTSIVDPNSDFTVYVAFKWDQSTPGSDSTIFGISASASGVPYLYLYADHFGNLRVASRDDSSTSATSVPAISLASTPNGIQLWEVRRSSTNTLDLTCLNTGGPSASGTIAAGTLTVDNAALGARYPNGGYDRGWNGDTTNPIYAAVWYSRAITSSTERDQIVSWFTTDRGLTLA